MAGERDNNHPQEPPKAEKKPGMEPPSCGVRALVLLVIVICLLPLTIGLVFDGPAEDRLVPGGLALMIAAMVGLAAYQQVRTGKMLVRETFWSSRFRWADRRERPIRYLLLTTMFVVLAIIMFIDAILHFVFPADVILNR